MRIQSHLALVCCMALSGAVLAQQVEVRGKLADYDPRRDDTAMKIVVRHDEIVRYGDANLLDVLRRLPGVTVSGTPGRGGEVRMQGLGNGYTQVLVDGERMPAGFAIDTLAPDAIERIEILRAASAELPTQAIAGTLNIVLRKARKTEREGKLAWNGGHGTRNPSAGLQWSQRGAGVAYALSADVARNGFDGDVPATEDLLDASGQRALLRTTAGHEHGAMLNATLAPRIEWLLGSGDTLGLETLATLNRFRVAAHAPTTTPLGAEAPYPVQDIGMRNDSGALRGDLRWTRKLADGGRLEAKFGVSAGAMEDTSTKDAGGNPAAGALAQRIASSSRDRGVSSTGKASLRLADNHVLGLGWDGGADRRTDARDERDLLPAGAGAADAWVGRIGRLALYAQDEWHVTPAWSAYLGTRWEGVRIRADGAGFGTARSRASVFSPIVQTLYKLPGKRNDRVRLAVARTYKAPGMEALLPHRYTTVNNSPVEPDVQGNPRLRPELALGIDAAWEHDWAEGAMLSLSASARRIDGYARYLVGEEGGRWVSRPENVGQASTRSLQLETRFPLRALLPAAPALNVRADVARNWSRVDAVPGPGNRLDRQVPLSANLGGDWQGERLSAGANLGVRDGAMVRVSDRQTALLHAERELELYAAWKLDAASVLRLSGLNLLGQDNVNETRYATGDGVLRNRLVNVRRPSLRATYENKF